VDKDQRGRSMAEKPVKVWGDNPPPKNPQIAGIRGVTNHIISQITGMGLDVVVSFSRHSKSRYLEVHTGRRRYIIRVSDHPLKSGKFDFDVFTDRPRYGAMSYLTLISLIEKRLYKIKKRKTG
jgi:hypothetical protein